jgi:hypothetical protein
MDHAEALLIGGRRAAISEANLTAVWGNYAALGYRRLVYTNTVNGREIGSELAQELANSARKSRLLDERAPVDTVRVEVLSATGWVNSR